MGTGSNAGREHVAGRAWVGQAQVRWNRLCSLTASLKLKAQHTHTEHLCYTSWAQTPARTLIPHNLKTLNHTPNLNSRAQSGTWR